MTGSAMRAVTLDNGVERPILGFGVYQIPSEQTEQAVPEALAAGYRLLDTAAAYRNEGAAGRAIKNSGKLWISDTGEENARRAFDEITPAANQIETHPFFQRTQYQRLRVERGVQIGSWGPFDEGRNNLFTHPVLSDIAQAHGRSVAQVVLRRLIQRDVVVIPKSAHADRMAENFDVFDLELTDDQLSRTAGPDTGHSSFLDHRDPAMAGRVGNLRLTD
ncbi:aldo/keto reductase [Nonomuraea sp. NPDC005650]|uniref:aldo/keto reductase n=1 Tax=Nonomuraea sp. NPDC005650 TaxID=3157045 RepID=UPI00339F40EB